MSTLSSITHQLSSNSGKHESPLSNRFCRYCVGLITLLHELGTQSVILKNNVSHHQPAVIWVNKAGRVPVLTLGPFLMAVCHLIIAIFTGLLMTCGIIMSVPSVPLSCVLRAHAIITQACCRWMGGLRSRLSICCGFRILLRPVLVDGCP